MKNFNDWFGIPGTCGDCSHSLWVGGRISLPTGEPLGICRWRPPKDFMFPNMPLSWGYVSDCHLVHPGDSGCKVHSPLEGVLQKLPVEAKTIHDSTLSWIRPMTSEQAARYHMTKGFVAAELYEGTKRQANVDFNAGIDAAKTAAVDSLVNMSLRDSFPGGPAVIDCDLDGAIKEVSDGIIACKK